MDVHSRDQLRFHFSLSLPSIEQPFQFFELVCCRGGGVECAHIKERLDKMTTNEVATRPPLAHDQVPRCWLPTGYNAKSSGTLCTIHILYIIISLSLTHST